MLPEALVGVSSIATRLRIRNSRSGLAARTIRLLVRASGTIVSCCAGAAAAARRLRRVAEHPVDALRDVERRGVPQGNQHRLGAVGLVDGLDDLADARQVAGVVGDHQRIAGGIGRDRVVAGDQRAQDRHQLRRRLVAKREDLRLNQVAGGSGRLLRSAQHRRAVLLRLGFRHDPDDVPVLDRRVALDAQCRKEDVVDQRPRDRLRRDDVDRALDPWIEHEVLARDLAHGLDHARDVGVDEVERDALGVRGPRPARAGEQGHAQQSRSKPASPHVWPPSPRPCRAGAKRASRAFRLDRARRGRRAPRPRACPARLRRLRAPRRRGCAPSRSSA